MAKPMIDDEIAVKWCKNFLKDLDPQKYYFVKADVDEFMAQATTLDDKIQRGQPRLRHAGLRAVPRSDRRAARDRPRAAQAEARLHRRRVDLIDDPDKIDYPADATEADGAVAEADQARPAPAQARQDRGRGGAQASSRSAIETGTGCSTSST